jgi:hypothetical protein
MLATAAPMDIEQQIWPPRRLRPGSGDRLQKIKFRKGPFKTGVFQPLHIPPKVNDDSASS